MSLPVSQYKSSVIFKFVKVNKSLLPESLKIADLINIIGFSKKGCICLHLLLIILLNECLKT